MGGLIPVGPPPPVPMLRTLAAILDELANADPRGASWVRWSIRKPARALEPIDSRSTPDRPRPNSKTGLHILGPEHSSSEVPSPPRLLPQRQGRQAHRPLSSRDRLGRQSGRGMRWPSRKLSTRLLYSCSSPQVGKLDDAFGRLGLVKSAAGAAFSLSLAALAFSPPRLPGQRKPYEKRRGHGERL